MYQLIPNLAILLMFWHLWAHKNDDVSYIIQQKMIFKVNYGSCNEKSLSVLLPGRIFRNIKSVTNHAMKSTSYIYLEVLTEILRSVTHLVVKSHCPYIWM